MNLGADEYITKPVAKADLLAAIHSRLERGSSEGQLLRRAGSHPYDQVSEVLIIG